MASTERIKKSKRNKTSSTEDALRGKELVKKSILVKDDGSLTRNHYSSEGLGDIGKIKSLLDSNQEKMMDADGIMDLLPDLYMVHEVLVSSILSPKDMSNVQLNFSTMKDAPPAINEILRTHFTTEFNLEAKLPNIVGDALFYYGSRSFLTLPPKAVENFIESNTVSLENGSRSLKRVTPQHLGFLGSAKSEEHWRGGLLTISTSSLLSDSIEKNPLHPSDFVFEPVSDSVSMENAEAGFNRSIDTTICKELKGQINISDDGFQLIRPLLERFSALAKTDTLLDDIYGLESTRPNKRPDRDAKKVKPDPYLQRVFSRKEVARMDNEIVQIDPDAPEDKELNPIILDIHHGAIIPVHVPGEPENHVGYYIAVDESGNIIPQKEGANFFQELNRRLMSAADSNQLQVMNAVGSNIFYNNNDSALNHSKPLLDVYISLLEEELVESVSNGVHKSKVAVSNVESTYRIMFARQLKGMNTTLVYVPASLVTYFTFDYDNNGIGISLLEKTKLYSSLRAILMFANIMAGVKNSVGNRILEITLDDRDPEKVVTVETIINEFMALQTSALPIGKLNAPDIINSLQKSGIQVVVDGGDYWPNTKIDIGEGNKSFSYPDTDLEDLLRRLHYAGLSVTPEQIDRTMEGDFATGLVSANIIQAKRTMQRQKQLVQLVNEFVRKYIAAGGPLRTELMEEYDNWTKKEGNSFDDLIESITITLPVPDTAVIANQLEELESYVRFVDTIFERTINTDTLSEILGGEHMREYVDKFEGLLKGDLIRNYMRRNNVLPELDSMLYHKESDPVDGIKAHNRRVMEILSRVINNTKKDEVMYEKRLKTVIDKVQEQFDKLNEEEPEDDFNTDDESGEVDDFSTPDDETDMGDEPVEEELEEESDDEDFGLDIE